VRKKTTLLAKCNTAQRSGMKFLEIASHHCHLQDLLWRRTYSR